MLYSCNTPYRVPFLIETALNEKMRNIMQTHKQDLASYWSTLPIAIKAMLLFIAIIAAAKIIVALFATIVTVLTAVLILLAVVACIALVVKIILHYRNK